MRFKENVIPEIQELLSLELHRYKREIPDMTNDEWNQLYEWVSSGNSPYTNGDGVYGDDGWPMDFVNTLRAWEAEREWLDSLSEEEIHQLMI
ncbi:MAG: hypothetical protein IKW81_06465 [Pseudobutyrivibrio sp.]|nr:hypothetical protein [Pseudobutyrivibrio sp.]